MKAIPCRDLVRLNVGSIEWVVFDLDDTLHNFREAAQAAIHQVVREISRETGAASQEVEARYWEIAARQSANAFVDGRTSDEYRRERLIGLFHAFKLFAIDRVETFLPAFDQTFLANTRLKPGAMALLKHLRAAGRKIAVISGGPSDAQARVIKKLGLRRHLDIVLTSGEVRRSKPDGLYALFLQRAAAAPAQVFVIGDSVERDMRPAKKLGCACVLVGSDPMPSADWTTVASLGEIHRFLRATRICPKNSA